MTTSFLSSGALVAFFLSARRISTFPVTGNLIPNKPGYTWLIPLIISLLIVSFKSIFSLAPGLCQLTLSKLCLLKIPSRLLLVRITNNPQLLSFDKKIFITCAFSYIKFHSSTCNSQLTWQGRCHATLVILAHRKSK
jgi:hypothetical protein